MNIERIKLFVLGFYHLVLGIGWLSLVIIMIFVGILFIRGCFAILQASHEIIK